MREERCENFFDRGKLRSNIGLNELFNIFEMSILISKELLAEEKHDNGSNTDYSEKSEVVEDLEKKIQRCGSATLYENRQELFEDEQCIEFNFFGNFFKLQIEFEK